MNNVIGFDAGTMYLVSASRLADDKVEIKKLRNMFLEVDPTDLSSTEISQTNWDYLEQKDFKGNVESIYIIGEDTFRFANIFGKQVNRPMKDGVISTNEIDAQDVLALMAEKLVGRSKGDLCVYSIPAQAVDMNIASVSYHESVWANIFSSLGYKTIPINEAQAIIYSNCKNNGFTGIAISFGCGLTNVCATYKGTPTLQFSICKGGDWIDSESARSIGMNVVTRVTRIKEKDLDLLSPKGRDKKETRIKMALTHYYTVLINHVLEVFGEQFLNASEGLEIDDEIPIILSGGTSMPKGFLQLFENIFNKNRDSFPYNISEIRMASNPLNAVAEGCLLYAMWKSSKEKK